MHRFLHRASELGIVVELTLFSNTYADNIWALNPLRRQNSKQGIGKVDWQDYTSTRDRELLERQLAYVRKLVAETSQYDNIYYEICNEAGGGIAKHATSSEVDAWQETVAHTIREELQKRNRHHLVFGLEAFRYSPRFEQSFDKSFAETILDAVNCHPLPGLSLGGRTDDLGNFMSKELKLGQVRDFCLAAQRTRKPCILDEDNAASLYRDTVGWTIHRKRAWTVVLSGAHYDFIDFSVTVGNEAGTAESQKASAILDEALVRLHPCLRLRACQAAARLAHGEARSGCDRHACRGRKGLRRLPGGRSGSNGFRNRTGARRKCGSCIA